MNKKTWTIIWIIIIVLFFGWIFKGIFLPSPQAKKVSEELNQKNNAFSQVVMAKQAELKTDSNIEDVHCFNQNKACFFALIIKFKNKPTNYQERLKKYTEELAAEKDKIFQSKLFGVSYRVIGKYNDSTSLMCEINEQNGPNYSAKCTTNFNPKEYE